VVEAGKRLEAAGADFLVLCTNTMHKLADTIQQEVPLPFLHIADATAEKIKANGIHTVGLLATRFTMEEDFYKGRLRDQHGLEVLVPTRSEMDIVHDIIYRELCRGEIYPESKQRYVEIIHRLMTQGAEAIILGCTEITLLIKQEDCPVPVFDTTAIHAEVSVEYALSE
jgi:aspartate racemase